MRKGDKETEKTIETVPLTEDQRIHILVAQMNERYQAWHHMRDRSTQFTLWILGLGVAASWRLLQIPSGDVFQKLMATGIVLLLGLTAIYFLHSIAGGVRTNREVLIKIEIALGAHRSGALLDNKVVLPPDYKEVRSRPNAHFCTLYVLLLVTSIYLFVAVWIPPQLSTVKESSNARAAYSSYKTGQVLSAEKTIRTPTMPDSKETQND